jgi:hypothetical protein
MSGTYLGSTSVPWSAAVAATDVSPALAAFAARLSSHSSPCFASNTSFGAFAIFSATSRLLTYTAWPMLAC